MKNIMAITWVPQLKLNNGGFLRNFVKHGPHAGNILLGNKSSFSQPGFCGSIVDSCFAVISKDVARENCTRNLYGQAKIARVIATVKLCGH